MSGTRSRRPYPGSALTQRERLVLADEALLDLAVGYPRLTPPSWLADLQRSIAVPQVASYTPPPSPVRLEKLLVTELLAFLGLPQSWAENSFLTFSGSVALTRALSVAVSPGGSARLPTPIFDPIPGLLRERSADLHWWLLDWEAPDWRRAGQALWGTEATIVVSPDNPSGGTASAAALRELWLGAESQGCTLVADQSFATLGRVGRRAPLLSEVADRSGSWIMLWDSGKTFDLGGEKIGLILASDPLRDRMARAVELVQGELSMRSLRLMSMVTAAARERDYLKWVAGVRGTNEEAVDELSRTGDLDVLKAEFGAFALVAPRSGRTEALIAAAERLGLGLLSTESFTRDTPLEGRTRAWIRLPLLRDELFFRRALDRLASATAVPA